MTKQESTALTPYIPRALQRELNRHLELMRANEGVTEAVINNGKAIHDHAVKRLVDMAHFDDFILHSAAQNLNGIYASLEEAINRQRVNDFEFIYQATVRAKTSLLRQAESMPSVPEKGLIAQLGDDVARLLDELDNI